MLFGLIIAIVLGTLSGIVHFYYERNKIRKNLGYELTREPLVFED